MRNLGKTMCDPAFTFIILGMATSPLYRFSKVMGLSLYQILS